MRGSTRRSKSTSSSIRSRRRSTARCCRCCGSRSDLHHGCAAISDRTRSETARWSPLPNKEISMQNQEEPIEIEPAHIRHFLAIHSALTPLEATMICELAEAFSVEELRVWFAQLIELTAPQAVQHIRVLLAGNTEAVS